MHARLVRVERMTARRPFVSRRSRPPRLPESFLVYSVTRHGLCSTCHCVSDMLCDMVLPSLLCTQKAWSGHLLATLCRPSSKL